MTATHRPAVSPAARPIPFALLSGWRSLWPGLVVVGLLIVWAVHDGGYDADTWYWGALLVLGGCALSLIRGGWGRIAGSRTALLAVGTFAAYVAWSYASIAWAASPGDALQGSNRALLYLLLFTLMLSLPWSTEAGLLALVAFALAVGVIAVVILLRLASSDHVTALVIDGRLASPTGYFNSTVALFSMDALLAIALAARRELPGLVRGTLIAAASASLQLALIGQSRGWLFTLPVVLAVMVVAVRDRLRVILAAVLPVAAALLPLHRLLDVYGNGDLTPLELGHAAHRAGQAGLMLCAAMLVAGTLIAWCESLIRPRAISRRARRTVGSALAVAVVALGCAGAVLATHGDPLRFISRQWNGFSHPPTFTPTGSHFATVGSGRYDFWRVSLDAVAAHPFGGLGQDNFADYYILHRRTTEDPSWTHSLEMRLLAHTGIVGCALFLAFLILALAAAARVRRRSGPASAALAGAALIPLIVWLLQGSVDWFWEIPALSGPALGFLALAIALGLAAPPAEPARGRGATARRAGPWRVGGALVGGLALVALVTVLAFPYLSVRKVSVASDISSRNPAAALSDLSQAASLNPLSAVPGRMAGTIALQNAQYPVAEQRFRQAIDREPGGWFAYFGDGLAASALGDSSRAQRDFSRAAAINRQEPAVKTALARVNSLHPLTPAAALRLLSQSS